MTLGLYHLGEMVHETSPISHKSWLVKYSKLMSPTDSGSVNLTPLRLVCGITPLRRTTLFHGGAKCIVDTCVIHEGAYFNKYVHWGAPCENIPKWERKFLFQEMETSRLGNISRVIDVINWSLDLRFLVTLWVNSVVLGISFKGCRLRQLIQGLCWGCTSDSWKWMRIKKGPTLAFARWSLIV